jgi:cytochrome P450
MRAPLYSPRADELLGPECIDDPHPLFARLRRDRPVSRVAETGVHLVASWDLLEEALGREEDFSANLTGVLIRGEDGRPTIFELPDNPMSRIIATADEPDHAVHRAIAQPRLSARRITQLEEPLRAWTRSALEAWLQPGGGDFVPIAEHIPARAVAHILGLPDGDVGRFRKWSMMGGDILAGDVDRLRLVALAVETSKMGEYLGEHLDEARADTRTGADAPLLHALAGGVHSGRIGGDEAVAIAAVMFGAGGESTAALIGSVVRRLAEDANAARELRNAPELIPRFVEEVARLEPPFKFHYRSVRRECELGGAELGPGDRLMLLWASANRDPSYFEEPETLRLDRRHPKHHLSFGRGAHFCIGAPLARLEARVVCEELLARTTQLSLCPGDAPAYARSIFVRRLERLPIRCTPHAC